MRLNKVRIAGSKWLKPVSACYGAPLIGSLGPRPTLQHWMYVSHHQHTQDLGGSGTLLIAAVLIVLWYLIGAPWSLNH